MFDLLFTPPPPPPYPLRRGAGGIDWRGTYARLAAILAAASLHAICNALAAPSLARTSGAG